LAVVLIQDGSADVNFGYRPLKVENIIYFSGAGNIVNGNLPGPTGIDSLVAGDTGLPGAGGSTGPKGPEGKTGLTGAEGVTPEFLPGATGLQGMTGIQWEIHIPFENFISAINNIGIYMALKPKNTKDFDLKLKNANVHGENIIFIHGGATVVDDRWIVFNDLRIDIKQQVEDFVKTTSRRLFNSFGDILYVLIVISKTGALEILKCSRSWELKFLLF
jgi:hypothetical protein